MHAIAHGAVRTYMVGEPALNVHSGRKIPCRTGESVEPAFAADRIRRSTTELQPKIINTVFVFTIFATAPPCLWGSSRGDHINENGCEKRTWFSNGGHRDANVKLACWAGMTGDSVRPAVGSAPVVYAIVINPELEQFQM